MTSVWNGFHLVSVVVIEQIVIWWMCGERVMNTEANAGLSIIRIK